MTTVLIVFMSITSCTESRKNSTAEYVQTEDFVSLNLPFSEAVI